MYIQVHTTVDKKSSNSVVQGEVFKETARMRKLEIDGQQTIKTTKIELSDLHPHFA